MTPDRMIEYFLPAQLRVMEERQLPNIAPMGGRETADGYTSCDTEHSARHSLTYPGGCVNGQWGGRQHIRVGVVGSIIQAGQTCGGPGSHQANTEVGQGATKGTEGLKKESWF